jgi:hypothetical protein
MPHRQAVFIALEVVARTVVDRFWERTWVLLATAAGGLLVTFLITSDAVQGLDR